MKKIMLLMVLIYNLYAVTNELDEQTKNRIEQIEKNFKTYSIQEAQNLKAISTFIDETNESKSNFNTFLQNAVKDPDWQKANNYLYNTSVTIKLPKQKNIDIPTYNKALEYFDKSAKRGNVIAAFQGMDLLEDSFMYIIGRNKFTDMYMETFTNVLIKQNYCKGYFYSSKLHDGSFGDSEPIKVIKTISFHDRNCLVGKDFTFYKKDMRLTKAKAEYIQKLREKR